MTQFDVGHAYWWANRVSAMSNRLEREDYWCRELCTYGGVGKKHGYEIRKRSLEDEIAINIQDILICMTHIEHCLRYYKSCFYV